MCKNSRKSPQSPQSPQSPAIFLDRDGTLIHGPEGHYTHRWEDAVWLPDTLDALAMLTHTLPMFRFFVVSNQAGIARGYTTYQETNRAFAQMYRDIWGAGGRLDTWVFCPHDIHDGCECRKPQPGMLYSLAHSHGINLRQSYMIGDWWSDIQAGESAGCKTILVRTGRGEKCLWTPEYAHNPPTYTARDLTRAVQWIIQDQTKIN